MRAPTPGELSDCGKTYRSSSPSPLIDAPSTKPSFTIGQQSSTQTEDNSSNTDDESDAETKRLLRQIQFGRSLMALAKDVKEKHGPLSAETERLIQVSLGFAVYQPL